MYIEQQKKLFTFLQWKIIIFSKIMKIPNPRQPSLTYALLIYMCIIVILITLIPFTFRKPEEIHITWSTNVSDFITNIILFLPIGFLFRLNRRRNKDRFCLQALGFGILLSLGIEFSQLFVPWSVPGRFTQVIDLIPEFCTSRRLSYARHLRVKS